MATDSANPERLYLMQLQRSIVPAAPGRSMEMVLVCYLVRTGDGRHILIDSGYPADVSHPPGASPPDGQRNVIDVLAEMNLRLDHIDMLICTHFDVNHAGSHDAFTRAELVVHRVHYARARSGNPRNAVARMHWDYSALR